MASHTKPGTGAPTYRVPAQTVWLTDDAEYALTVFKALLDDRAAATTGRAGHRPTVNRAELDAALSELRDTPTGHLLHTAVVQAETIPMPWTKPLHDQTPAEYAIHPQSAAWDMAVILAGEQARFTAPALPIHRDDTCRHGVPFADDCTDCEADA
jgi:hypothetical protein